jgi:hypothetical protein
VNALQFAEDPVEGLAELARVTRPGGLVAVANWADAAHNDLDTVEDAVARAAGEEPADGGPAAPPGRAGGAVRRGPGLPPVAAGLTDVPWSGAGRRRAGRRGPARRGRTRRSPSAARPSWLRRTVPRPGRRFTGLANAFRWAVARVPETAAGSGAAP